MHLFMCWWMDSLMCACKCEFTLCVCVRMHARIYACMYICACMHHLLTHLHTHIAQHTTKIPSPPLQISHRQKRKIFKTSMRNVQGNQCSVLWTSHEYFNLLIQIQIMCQFKRRLLFVCVCTRVCQEVAASPSGSFCWAPSSPSLFTSSLVNTIPLSPSLSLLLSRSRPLLLTHPPF